MRKVLSKEKYNFNTYWQRCRRSSGVSIGRTSSNPSAVTLNSISFVPFQAVHADREMFVGSLCFEGLRYFTKLRKDSENAIPKSASALVGNLPLLRAIN